MAKLPDEMAKTKPSGEASGNCHAVPLSSVLAQGVFSHGQKFSGHPLCKNTEAAEIIFFMIAPHLFTDDSHMVLSPACPRFRHQAPPLRRSPPSPFSSSVPAHIRKVLESRNLCLKIIIARSNGSPANAQML